MKTNTNHTKNSHFFSLDLTVGYWQWWFSFVVMFVSTLSMVIINAAHHVLLVIIFVITIMLSLLVKPRTISTQEYGLVWHNPRKLISWTLIAVILFAGLVYWFEHSSAEAMDASKKVIESLKFGESYQRDLLLILTVCVFAPINEELIYRAVIFKSIWNSLLKKPLVNKWLSFGIATAVSGFLFMSAHGGGGQDTQIYMILLLGMIACALYAFTGSIIAPIMFHGLNNTFALWQSFHAKHMTFSQGVFPLDLLMLATPFITLALVLLMRWVVWKIARHTT